MTDSTDISPVAKDTSGNSLFAKAMVMLSWFFVLSFFLMPIALVCYYTYEISKEQQMVRAQQGYFDFSEISLEDEFPLWLSGNWIAYEDLFLEDDWADSSTFSQSTLKTLPIQGLKAAQGTVTYQGFVSWKENPLQKSPTVLGMRFLSSEVNVYLNGTKLEPMDLQASGTDDSVTLFALNQHYNPNLVHQEILISTNANPEDTDLYGRVVMLSTAGNLIYYENSLGILEFFFIGVVYCMMMVGFIYLIMRPARSVLSLVNLFDTVLMSYVVYTHTSVSPNMGEMFPILLLNDAQMQGASLFFLCMTGTIGNDLAKETFPTLKKANPLLENPFNYFFIFLAIVFALEPYLYDLGGKWLVVLLFVVEAATIFWRMKTYKKEVGLSPYMGFQVMKTAFILGVVAVDIFFVPHIINMKTLMAALYGLFLIVHLFIRAYEYALPEKKLAEVNKNLEETIARRTKELVETNKALTELSIRDSMTKLYNRLHFEAVLEQSIALVEQEGTSTKNIHLCLFDLDNFKQINDNFGHNVGDDQLKDVARLLLDLLPQEVLFSRIGGEEFTLLFENMTDEEAISWVERARRAIEILAEQEGRTTGSFGLCRYGQGMGRKDFFVEADDCLYHSKNKGKNCVTYNVRGEKILKSSH